jgi:hypothetical protein
MSLIPETLEVEIKADVIQAEGGTLCAMQALLGRAHAELNTLAAEKGYTLTGKPMVKCTTKYGGSGFTILSKATKNEETN